MNTTKEFAPRRDANYMRRGPAANRQRVTQAQQEDKPKVVRRHGISYTLNEANKKNYTVNQAVEAARVVLAAKRFRGVCLDSVSRDDLARKITLIELNEISMRIVDDTFYWEGHQVA